VTARDLKTACLGSLDPNGLTADELQAVEAMLRKLWEYYGRQGTCVD
jgi:hypothetical protein